MDLRFIPKSGVAFIFVSVLIFLFWAGGKGSMSFYWAIISEAVAFIICFFGADIESKRK